MTRVTDPSLLAQLEGGAVSAPAAKPVTDPAILAQLEGTTPAPKKKGFIRKAFDAVKRDLTTNYYAEDENTFSNDIGGAIKSVADSSAVVGSAVVSPIVTGIAGYAGMLKQGNTDAASRAETIRKTQEALTYKPRTTEGEGIQKAIAYPFEKLAEGGAYLGEKTYQATGSPVAAASVDTSVNMIPFVIPFLKKGYSSGKAALMDSEFYRKATIPERELVVQTLDEVAAGLKAQGWSDSKVDAKLARMSPEYFQEQLAKRVQKPSEPVSEAAPAEPASTVKESLSVQPAAKPVTDPAIIAQLEAAPVQQLPAYTPQVNNTSGLPDSFIPQQSEVIANGEGNQNANVQGRQEGRGQGLLETPAADVPSVQPVTVPENTPAPALNNTIAPDAQISPVTPSSVEPIQAPSPRPETQADPLNIQPEAQALPERRTDLSRREKWDSLTPEEQYAQAHLDPLTGLLNKHAFDFDLPLAEKAGKTIISGDVSGLKWANDNIGHDQGDVLLKHIADAFRENGLEAYRKGGDEFALVFDKPTQADALLSKVNDSLRQKKVVYTSPEGVRYEYTGFKLDYGAGPTFTSADEALLRNRARAEAAGTRNTDRKSRPYGVAENVTPRGETVSGTVESVAPEEVNWKALLDSANRAENQSFSRHKSGNGVATSSEFTRWIKSQFPQVSTKLHYGKQNVIATLAKLSRESKVPFTDAQAEIRDAFIEDIANADEIAKSRPAETIDESGWQQEVAPELQGDKKPVQFGDSKPTGRNIGLSEFMDGFTPDPQQDLFSKKPSSGNSHADTGGYNLDPPGPQNAPFGQQKVSALELPEIVEIAKNLMNGKYPHILRKMNKRGALGVFKTGKGSIDLLADIAKTPGLLERVLAHEVGHLVDWLPDQDIKRGNILGRLASLKKYMKTLLEEYEGAPGAVLNTKDRARLRREAEKELKANERPDETVIETITREVPQFKYSGITPEMIKDLLGMEAREKYPKLYRAFQEMDTAEKKAVLVQAMKGMVHDSVSHFGERVQVGSETVTEQVTRTIPGIQATPEAISKRYAELVQEEIDKRILYKREQITQELKDLTLHWKPFSPGRDPGYTAYRFSSVELYADAFSALINDPALLRKIAPTFEKAFFSYLGRKPEVSELYYGIQQRLGNTDEVMSRRAENVRGMFDRGEEVKKGTEKLQVSHWLKEIYRELVDVNADINWKVREAKKLGFNVTDAENPQYWVEQLPYVSSDVFGHLSGVSQAVLEPMGKAELTLDDIGEEMFYKRVASGDRTDLANPLGHTKETAQAGLEDMKQRLGVEKFAEIERLISEYRQVREKNVIAFIDKADMWSPELMEHVKNNDEYATFELLKFIESKYGRGVSSQIYKQVGTLQEIRNPFIATVMKDVALIRAANIKMAKKATTDFMEKYFPAEIVPAETRWNGKGHEPVESKDPGQGMIMFPHKGEIKAYYVPKGIADTFEKNPYMGGIIARALSMVSQIPRNVMVSKNPAWMAANLPRDFIASWKNLPGMTLLDLVNYYRKATPHAWNDAVKGQQSDLVHKMLRDKELVADRQFSSLDEAADDEINRMLEQFGKSPVQYRNKVIKPIMAVWDHLDRLGKFTERVGKIAGHMALEDQGIDPMKRAHIVRNRVGTPDVKAGGRLKPIYNNMFMFSNVNIQGWRASKESAQDTPFTYAWKTAAFNVVPTLLRYAATIGLMGAAIKEVMDGVGEYYNTNYIVVPLGKDKNNKSVVMTIPQDYTGQVVGGLFWKALNGEVGGEKGLLSYATEQTPYSLNPVIALMADTVQVVRGQNPYDDYRGKQAIPEAIWKADDSRKWKELAKYEWNQIGGGSIYKFSGSGLDRVQSEFEKALKLPGGNVVGRFIRVTDQGQREELKEVKENVGKKEARRSLDVKEAIIEDINDKGGKPTVSDKVKLYRSLMEQKKISIDTKFSEFRPRYERYANKVDSTPQIDAVIDATNLKEKSALLQHYKATMSEKAYQDIVRQLIVEGHMKSSVFKQIELEKAGVK
jgi:GGDEF domain-containing protein